MVQPCHDRRAVGVAWSAAGRPRSSRAGGAVGPGPCWRPPTSTSGSPGGGQVHGEAGALAGVAVDLDGAAVGFDDLAADVQAQAQTAVVGSGGAALEAFEQA